jgi:hypothetical protein
MAEVLEVSPWAAAPAGEQPALSGSAVASFRCLASSSSGYSGTGSPPC